MLRFCVTCEFAIRELELYGVKITGGEKRLEGQKDSRRDVITQESIFYSYLHKV